MRSPSDIRLKCAASDKSRSYLNAGPSIAPDDGGESPDGEILELPLHSRPNFCTASSRNVRQNFQKTPRVNYWPPRLILAVTPQDMAR